VKTTAGEPRSKFAAALCFIAPTVRSLLASFPAIVGDGKGKPSPKHKIRHTLETTGRPVFAKARRLDPDKLCQGDAEFRQLKAAGIIHRSDSPWLSPLHMVPKKDGSWRPCGDYRCLNLAMAHDRYLLPSVLDLSIKLHCCKFFSCIDLVKGYQWPPRTSSKRRLSRRSACSCISSCLSICATPPRPSSASWTGYSNTYPSCSATWMTSSASRMLEDHHEHLLQIFTIFQENGLQINPAKCVFASAAVEFLTHRVGQHGVQLLQRHVQAISEFPPTQDVNSYSSF
jgi:cleavage and polyadenylation specificity factor subunit 1